MAKKIRKKKTTTSSPAKKAPSASTSERKKSIAKKPATRITKKRSAQRKAPSLAARLLYGTGPEYRLVNQRTNSIERVIDRHEMVAEFELRADELKRQYQQAGKAIKRVTKWVKAGYFGQGARCTIALRRKFGRIISPLRYCIEVHVPAKVSQRHLKRWPKVVNVQNLERDATYCVPSEVSDVLTKVVESMPYRTDAASLSSSRVEKSGMVRMSDSGVLADISTDSQIKLSETQLIGGLPTVEIDMANWGTFGIAYQDAVSAKVYGLVNAHFASGSMVQPAHKPPTTELPKWEIGRIAKGKKFEGKIDGEKAGEKFYVDAALILLNNNRTQIINLVQDFEEEGFLYAASYLRHFHADSPRRDIFQKVFKFGARTSALKKERIEGQIENPEDNSVSYNGQLLGSAIMARSKGNVAFTLAGDSGSALVAPIFDLETNREKLLVIGLCFAGDEGVKEVVYACQFAAVIKALKLRISKDLLRKDWRYKRL